MYKVILVVLFLLCFSSCINLSPHQTARTLGKGEVAAVASMDISSYGFYEYFSPGDFTYDVGILFGVKDDLDFGVEFSLADNIRLTTYSKYQFLGDRQSRVASSIGLDIGTMIPLVQIGYQNPIYHTSLLYYNSWYLADKFSLSLSPRYTFAYGAGELDYNHYESVYEFEKRNHIFGYHFAVTFGKYDQLSFEFSQFWNNRNLAYPCNIMFGVGVLFR